MELQSRLRDAWGKDTFAHSRLSLPKELLWLKGSLMAKKLE